MPIAQAFGEHIRRVLDGTRDRPDHPPVLQGQYGEILSITDQTGTGGRALIQLRIDHSPMAQNNQPMFAVVELNSVDHLREGRYLERIEHEVQMMVRQYEHQLDRWLLTNPIPGYARIGEDRGRQIFLVEVEGDAENRKFRIEHGFDRERIDEFIEFTWPREAIQALRSGDRLKRELAQKAQNILMLAGAGKVEWQDVERPQNDYNMMLRMVHDGVLTPQEATRRLHAIHEQVGALRPEDAYIHRNDVEIMRNRDWVGQNYDHRIQRGAQRG